MTYTIDHTHAPTLTSWLASANIAACEFPIQNLPFGRFTTGQSKLETKAEYRIGVAIGDQVLDLQAAGLLDTQDVNAVMARGPAERLSLRHAISAALASHASSETQARLKPHLYAMSEVTMGLPCHIGDYTDFYTGIHHAQTIGAFFRPDAPLLPNYKWVPIAYHGRASSICASGHHFRRPKGQAKSPDIAGVVSSPTLKPTARLDYELELGIFMGTPNTLGEAVNMQDAEAHVFGMALFNDWSARDVQAWEYQPLGPFLAKNFASTVSPWIVTMEALAPYRCAPQPRPVGDPQALPYLDAANNRAIGGVDIKLEVWLQTAKMKAAGYVGDKLSTSNFTDAYWTIAQMVAHHSVNGCNLQSGDLLGSGTLSGAKPEQGASLMELSQNGKREIVLSNGETRTFLADGDTVILRGFCDKAGSARIGFGECRATVLAAV